MKVNPTLFLFRIILICNIIAVKGQSSVTGNVTDTENNAISGVLVMILDPNEYIISSEITDTTGTFSIPLPLHRDNHSLVFSSFGYITKKWALDSAIEQKTFVLESNSQVILPELTIVANRPAIIRKTDRFVIPKIYESELAKGKDMIDFLGYAPLVKVSTDGKLQILGKGNVTIYVNGRRSYIDLKNLPAENIENVEIITHPGSEYPATDRNGIINVILRKQPDDGVLVNTTIRDSQRKKSTLNSPSLSLFLNIQKKKINIVTGFTTSYDPHMQSSSERYNYYSDSLDTHICMNNVSKWYDLNGFINSDYHIDEKQTVGFGIVTSSYSQKEQNEVEATHRFLNANEIDSLDFTDSELKMKTPVYNIRSNLNYNIKINARQKLLFDFNYNHRFSDMPYYLQNTKQKGEHTQLSAFHTNEHTLFNGYGFTSRFQHQFTPEMHLNTGAECYGSKVNSTYFYGTKSDNDYISDPLRSNTFIYKDITGATYIDYDWEISDNLSISAGLRGEYYACNGVRQTTGELISNKDFDIFPSFSVYYAPHDDHEFSFDFTKSHSLPSYGILNPFRKYYSVNLYQENNPYLQPSKHYDFSFDYTFFSDYMLIFEYNYYKNSYTQFRIPVGNGITKITTMNQGKSHAFWLTFSAKKRLFHDYLYLSFDADIDYNIEKDIPDEIVAYNASWVDFMADLKINTALNKKKDWRLETRFLYYPQFRTVALTRNSNYYLAVSITKNFKNSTLSFGVNDIINKPVVQTSNHSRIYAYRITRDNYGRIYWISYNIKLGNNNVRGTATREPDKIKDRM